jgi:ribokinase
MPARITVLGNINLDFSIQAERMPEQGENLVAEEFELIPGGKGANQAVAAARLGAEVVLVGSVGNDNYGRVLRRRLSHEGVNVKFVRTDEEAATGMAFVFVARNTTDNRILSVLGSNLACTPDHIEAAHRAFERADFFVTALGVPEAAVNRALQIAADCAIPALLDPSPLGKRPPQLWNSAGVLTPNQTEASRLTGETVKDLPSALTAAQKMARRGIPRIAITLGKLGCLLHDLEGGRYIPGFKTQVVDPTGAGDAFAAALAVRLAEQATFDEAATFANAAGALACTVHGAQPSLPTREEVEALLKRTRRDKKLKVELL